MQPGTTERHRRSGHRRPDARNAPLTQRLPVLALAAALVAGTVWAGAGLSPDPRSAATSLGSAVPPPATAHEDDSSPRSRGWVAMRPGTKYGMAQTLTDGLTATGVRLWAAGGPRDQHLVAALYSIDASGRPQELVTRGTVIPLPAHQPAGYLTLPLARPVSAPGRYVVAVVPQDEGRGRVYWTSTVGGGLIGGNEGMTPTSTWGWASQVVRWYSMALVASGSPTPAPTPTATPTASTPTTSPPSPTPSTPTTSPTTTATPPSSAKPDASSTGVVAGVPLTSHPGAFDAAADGTVLKNAWVHGSLFISGNNVTVDNVKVDGEVFINLTPRGGLRSPVPTNVRLHRVDAEGIFSNGFNGLTLDGLNLHDQLNAPHAQLFNYADPGRGLTFPARNLVLQNSWFHGVRLATSQAHMENVHTGGIQGALIKNNVFDLYSPDGAHTLGHFTGNFVMEPAMYGVFSSNVTLDGNWMGGGGYYQAYLNMTGTSKVVNNKFRNDSPHFTAVQYPPSAYVPTALPPGGYVKFAQSGNTLNGNPVTLPGGR